MKKLVFSLFAIASIAFSGLAQQTNECKNEKKCESTKKECCQEKRSIDRPKECDPFANLELTAEQKVKLEALKGKCAAEKAEKDIDREKCKGEEKGKALLSEIKSILTPEQYVQFLENQFVAGGHKEGKPHHGKLGKPGEGPKDCDKKDCCKKESKKECDKKECKKK